MEMRKGSSCPKGYKQTEIGIIPEDWDVVSVGNITTSHKQGFYTTDKYVDDGTYLVRITDLMNPSINYIGMPKLQVSRRDFELFKIRKNDFLFARDRKSVV
jgi:type I restriction enzyme S subunit